MSVTEILTVVASLGGAAVAGWLTARKAIGSKAVAKIIERFAEETSIRRHPVVLVAADPAKAAELRTTLIQRGFRNLSIAGPDFRGEGQAVVVVAKGLDLPAFAASSGLAEGLVFTTETIEPKARPPGDWTFANSPISLFARLAELIHWQRATGG